MVELVDTHVEYRRGKDLKTVIVRHVFMDATKSFAVICRNVMLFSCGWSHARSNWGEYKPLFYIGLFFKRVKVFALTMPAQVGKMEIAALMQGKTDGDANLPVEATETRVNV